MCWAITIPIALQTQGVINTKIIPPVLQWLIGFVPLIAALLVGRFRDFKADALRFRVSYVWYLFALIFPWVVLGISLLVRQIGGLELPEIEIGMFLLPVGVIWLILAFGEEAGWRAFALPRMIERFGFWQASTILGVLWCVWHFPKLFSSPYLKFNLEGFGWVALFSIQILVANYFICWLFVKTRSAILTSIFHASWNAVATAYLFAATDLIMTVILLIITILAFIFTKRTRLDFFEKELNDSKTFN